MEDLLRLVSRAGDGIINWREIEAALSSFVLPMSSTEQNPAFHAEGDVWTHTKMVCEELVSLEDYQKLTGQRRQAVFLAALLHDVGKIHTTRWEDDRWTSPNHTLAGSKLARLFLWQDLGLCGTPEKQQLRETVCNLIRYHSFPAHAIDDPQGRRKLTAMAANGEACPMFHLELLCILCQADALGRICQSPQERRRMAEQVQLCAELARESGCFYGPYPFSSPHTRYGYLSGMDIPPEAELYDDTWGEVILLSGLPGTGKDTWIRENCFGLPVISLDEIRDELGIAPTGNQSKVIELARERAKELLRNKQSFVWNATNLSPMVRSRQISLFTRYHASSRIVYLETNWREQLRRNQCRAACVPEQVICRMLEELVPPEGKEAYCVQWQCV